MIDSAYNTVGCPGCGKRFVWKAELAGQAVRCTCGKAFLIADGPENLPLGSASHVKPTVIGAGDFESVTPARGSAVAGPAFKCPSCNLPMKAGAAVCLNCGYDVRRKGKVGTRVGDDEADPPGDAPPASGPPPTATDAARVPPEFVLPNDQRPARTPAPARGRSAVTQALTRREDDQGESTFLNFHLPIIFIALGLIFSVIAPMLDGKSAATGLIIAGMRLLLKVPVMLVALMLTAKLMGIAYGPLTTSLLKLAGIAMGPMALADLILVSIMGATMGMGIWFALFLYLVFAGIPLSYMFDLDLDETCATLAVIIGLEIVFNVFVFALVLAMLS